MKKGIIALFIIFIILSATNICYCKEEQIGDEINLATGFAQCLEDINIEDEVKSYLGEDSTYINLKECLEIALLYNFYLKSANFDYIRSSWEYKNSLTNFLPDLSVSNYSVYYSGQVLVGAALLENFNELALSVYVRGTHQLTKGGEQIFEARMKKNLKFAQRHNLEYTRSEVLLYTAQYYYELLRAKLNIEIYQKNYKERCVQLLQTENLMQAGLGTKFDVIRSKTELAQAKQNLLDALQEFRLSQARLANIMGVEITLSLMPVELEAQEYMLIDKEKTIEDLYNTACLSREDVKKIRSQIQALKEEKRMIYTQFVPRPRIIAQEQWQGTAKVGMGPAIVLGVYADWNLGQNMGAGTITQAKAKQAQIDKTIIDLEQSLRDIKESILKDYYESKISQDRIAISKEQVQYATQSVKLAELRLDAGEGILIDVIQAQTFKTKTRVELVNSIIRYNIAQVQMLFDSGIISKNEILKNYNP